MNTFSAYDVHVQMCQACGNGQCHLDQGGGVYGPRGQEVEERPVLVVVRDQPKLRPCAVVWEKRWSMLKVISHLFLYKGPHGALLHVPTKIYTIASELLWEEATQQLRYYCLPLFKGSQNA